MLMNETPQRPKFRESFEKRHIIDTPWPKHIPDRCPKCHTSLRRKVNLFHTRSGLAQRLHSFAPWLSVIILLTVLIIMAFATPQAVSGGQGSPMALCAMIAGPPVILTIIANCIPKVLKLICHRCKLTQEFPHKDTIEKRDS